MQDYFNLSNHHMTIMKNYKQIDGVLKSNDKGFAIVQVNETQYTVDNWFGTKKQFNISQKDLPLNCKGIVNKFTGRLFGTHYKRKNFTIMSVDKK